MFKIHLIRAYKVPFKILKKENRKRLNRKERIKRQRKF